MTADIWSLCVGGNPPPYHPLNGIVIRVVESQEQIATMNLVDTLAEQDRLEHLLDSSKPAYRFDATNVHYLLTTPFRYPPLKHGSRFGSRFESSLFYGSRKTITALAETAYYRFVLWNGMITPPPSGCYKTQHTVFGAAFVTPQGAQLQNPPFNQQQEVIRDKTSYRATQLLGQKMRECGIEAVEYRSARDPSQGINVALYSPDVFVKNRPVFQDSYVCETTSSRVAFISGSGQRAMHRFNLADFLIDEQLPCPAT